MNGTKSPCPGILGIVSISMFSAFPRDKLSVICNSVPKTWVLVPIPSPTQDHCSSSCLLCTCHISFSLWFIPITIKHVGISPTFKTKNSAWTPYPLLPLFSCSFQHSSLKRMALLSLLLVLPFSLKLHSSQAFVTSTPENQLLSRLLTISIMPGGQFSFFIWPLFLPSFLVYFFIGLSGKPTPLIFPFIPVVSPFQTPFLSFHHPILQPNLSPLASGLGPANLKIKGQSES